MSYHMGFYGFGSLLLSDGEGLGPKSPTGCIAGLRSGCSFPGPRRQSSMSSTDLGWRSPRARR